MKIYGNATKCLKIIRNFKSYSRPELGSHFQITKQRISVKITLFWVQETGDRIPSRSIKTDPVLPTARHAPLRHFFVTVLSRR